MQTNIKQYNYQLSDLRLVLKESYKKQITKSQKLLNKGV